MSRAAVPIATFLRDLTHPLRAEIDVVRAALGAGHPRIVEQVKWNAPSFSVDGVDIVTLMLRRPDEVLVIFHHPETPAIASPLLTGDYADGRRIALIRSLDDAHAAAAELTRVTAALAVRAAGSAAG